MSGPFGKIHNKQCCCDGDICCEGRGLPGEDLDNPIPTSLHIQFFDPSPEGCFDITGTLTLTTPYSERTWIGIGLQGTCNWCGQYFTMRFDCQLVCNATGGWLLSFDESTPDAGDCGTVPVNAVLSKTTCDPILLFGDVDCFPCANMICQNPGDPPLPYPHDPFCLSVMIWED